MILCARNYLTKYGDDGPAWMWLGDALTDLARFEEARTAYQKAIKCLPRKKRQIAFAAIGHLYFAAGNRNRAASWYQKAIAADPNDASYYIYLGGLRAQQGRFDEAARLHRKATSRKDGRVDEAFLNLGFVLRARERFNEAADCFRKALQIAPKYPEAKSALRDVQLCIVYMKKHEPVTTIAS